MFARRFWQIFVMCLVIACTLMRVFTSIANYENLETKTASIHAAHHVVVVVQNDATPSNRTRRKVADLKFHVSNAIHVEYRFLPLISVESFVALEAPLPPLAELDVSDPPPCFGLSS